MQRFVALFTAVVLSFAAAGDSTIPGGIEECGILLLRQRGFVPKSLPLNPRTS